MKDKFSASLQLKEASGFGWDEARDVWWQTMRCSPGGRVNARARQSEYMDIGMEQVDSYTIPSSIDHNVIMEELINQGIDMHTTSLKDLEAEITSTNAAEKGKQTGASSGSKRSRQLFMEDDRARIISTMAATSENIARITDTFSVEGELAVRRQSLYQELCTFPDLNQV
ncbi:hypothetical protein LINPERHAP2_LOCUS2827 [Linum perenne]